MKFFLILLLFCGCSAPAKMTVKVVVRNENVDGEVSYEVTR